VTTLSGDELLPAVGPPPRREREHPDEASPLRVLFTTVAATGHFQPLVPFARALLAAGHIVAFATTPDFVAAIESSGFRCFAVGVPTSPKGVMEERGIDRSRLSPEEANLVAWRWFFLGEHKRREIRELRAVIADWRPDLIVREETEFAGCVAAERVGLPHAAVQIVARGLPPEVRTATPARSDALRAAVGLPPDPELESWARYLYLCPFPPSLQRADAAVPLTRHVLRPAPVGQARGEGVPDWLTARRDQPLIYATLGTAQNHRADVFAKILAGLREEPFELVVTVGRNQEPSRFGEQPPHVHIERYIPQSLLYPHCAAVVAHGGSGTLMGALEHGLPLVLLPLGADQPANAEAAEAAGVALVLDPARMTPGDVRDAVRAVLTQRGYQHNARRLQAEIVALPEFDQGTRLLERLARTKTPLRR
jgi:UDP:flavonoid glycosyltransferase YjiC (YdhE family)